MYDYIVYSCRGMVELSGVEPESLLARGDRSSPMRPPTAEDWCYISLISFC